MKREDKSLSALAAIMTQYPQYMVNLTVSPEGKLHFYTDPEIKRALDVARQKLGDSGRVVVRPSGTEPLIRVMAEGMDAALTREVVDQTAAVIEQRLGNRN